MQLRARADLSRFLSACYYEPAPEFEEEKLFDSMVEAAAAVNPELARLAERLRSEFRRAPLQKLLVDYTRLFLGPNGALALPYGSAWLTGEKTLMQDSTMALVELYETGGFEICDDFRELPDHVAVELELLYLLLYRECAGCGSEEAAQLRRRLLNEHLGRWIPAFTAAVRQGATSGFYRTLADLTEHFIHVEATHHGGTAVALSPALT